MEEGGAADDGRRGPVATGDGVAGPAAAPHVPTVLLVDDHPCFREGLRDWLEHEGEFVVLGEAGDGGEALRLIRALRPDIVVLDLVLPRHSGLAVLGELRRTSARTRAVIFTGYSAAAEAEEAIELGAAGYVLKGADYRELIAAVRAALAGRPAVQPEVARRLKRRDEAAARYGLTPREREVLRLVGERLHNREIAERLGRSEKTVENHIGHLIAKLDAASRTDLVRRAREAGLLS